MPAPKLPDMTFWEAFRYCSNSLNGHEPFNADKLRRTISILRENAQFLKAALPMADRAEVFLRKNEAEA
jgi:hypothetical protein